MKRSRLLAAVALLAVLAGVSWLLGAAPGTGGASSLSRAPEGLLAARRYLEERGNSVTLTDRPFDESLAQDPGVLVISFPWSLGGRDDPEALSRLLGAGGTVLLAYSSRHRGLQEELVLTRLGWTSEPAREPPPLGYRGWRRWSEEIWTLPAEDGGGPGLVLRAPSTVLVAPSEAKAWYRDPTGERPIVFSVEQGSGRVVAVPVELLSNAGLSRGENFALLDLLSRRLGDSWSFDEYHHGLVTAAAAPALVPAGIFGRIALHLALLYVLAIVAMSRRFGPPWRSRTVRSGSVGGFLRGLGTLHDRLGHHADAGRLLVERVRELEPHRRLPAELPPPVDGAGLVRLGRVVATYRRWRETP